MTHIAANSMLRLRLLALSMIGFLVIRGIADAGMFERLQWERLKATHDAVIALNSQRQPVKLTTDWQDYRVLVHVHSSLSHDSRGTLDEIVAAAKATGVRALLFTEHPGPNFDYFTDGHRGLVDDVLLIPGAETPGLLIFPKHQLDPNTPTPQALADATKKDGGLVFLSHLEERMDWNIKGLDGTEIYNTHADIKDEVWLREIWRTPVAMANLLAGLKHYPQETFAALQDYPADYLRRYDELCATQRLTGIAANDSHHNQVYRARIDDQEQFRLEDNLGKRLATANLESFAWLRPLIGSNKPSEPLFEIDLDPYDRSFRHVSTHLWVSSLSEENIREALHAGRAYVAFDWMADPTGFVFIAEREGKRWMMGEEVPGAKQVHIRAGTPLPVQFRLLRNGREIARSEGREFDQEIDQPGQFRIEAWLTLAGEPRPWILSNPIYVRER
jgi:hypothetical protein